MEVRASDYRGHRQVTVTDRSGAATIYYTFTGMYDDRYSVANTSRFGDVSNAEATMLTGHDGVARQNKAWAAGTQLGTLSKDNLARTHNTTVAAPESVLVNAVYPEARRVSKVVNTTKVFNHLNNTVAGERTWEDHFNTLGQHSYTLDHGAPAAGDETTSFTHYIHNTSDWLVAYPHLVTQRGGLIANDPWGDWISAAAYNYDGQAFGQAPTQGAVTVDHQQLRQDAANNPVWKIVGYAYNGRGQATSRDEINVGVTTMDYNSTWGYQEWVDGPLPGTADRTDTVVDQRFGVETSIDPPDTAATSMVYDTLGRLTSVSKPGAPSESYKFAYSLSPDHTAAARTTSQTLQDPGIYETSYQFVDGFGRQIQTQQADGANNTIVSGTAYERTGRPGTQYHPVAQAVGAGSLLTLDNNGVIDAITYDADGKVTTQRKEAGAVKATSTSTPVGLTSTVTDWNNHATTSTLDVYGRVISTTDPIGATTTFEYNLRGDRTKITDAAGNNITTTYTDWETQPTSLNDPDLGTINYAYDNTGRLTSQTDGRGVTIDVEWRADRQPTRLTAGGHTVSDWTYQASGRLEASSHYNLATSGQSAGTVTKTYDYDTRGRHTATTWDIPGLTQPGNGGNNGGGGGPAGGIAHVIVGNGGSPVAGDLAVIDRLENDLGYTVTVVDDGAPEDVAGADFVVITQSVGTTQITGKYVDEPVPVLTMSAPTWDEHNLVTNQSASYPYTTSDTLHIEQAGHATVAGASAPTLTTGRPVGYAFDSDVPNDAEIIAAAKASTPDRASLIVFETGDNDATNTPVPEKRALLGFRHNVIADLTTGGGWAIFDNTIAWLHPAPEGGGGNNGGGGAAGGVAHVIVGNGGSPVAGDLAVIDRLENDLGYAVTVVDDGAPENVAGADLVVVTQSVGTTQITGKYVDEAVPVLTMSAPTWDEHNLVANQSASYPYTTSDTLHIEEAGHATVAGATAPTLTSGRPVGYAFDSDVPNDAEIIAAAKASTPDRASLIVFETGDNDATNTPVLEKRALLGFRHNLIADLTAGGGWAIFDNTIAWLHPAPGGGGDNGGGGGPAGPQTIAYTYTEAGEPDTISYPDGTVVDVDYNALGQPNQLVADQATIVDQVSFNARGQLIAATVGTGNNQLTRAWAHENWSGRLLNQTSYLPGGANVQSLSYGYDAGGNVTLMRDQTAGIDQWLCFTYDNADRLTTGYTRADGNCAGHQPAAGPDPYNVALNYNQIGNITNATGTGTVNGSYTYGAGNAGPHAATAAGPNTYVYDQSGNMTSRTTGIGAQNLAYDVQNRVQTITGAGPDLTALYDADGTRVKRTLDGTATYYLGPNYELNDDGAGATMSLHHRLAGHHLASLVNGQVITVTDAQLGTITGTVDSAGNLVAQRYTPHGVNRTAASNQLPFDFTFTGQTNDLGTGLIDYNARHYDPQLGRFTQADTVLDGLNRYTYVHNNPLRYSDPTGHLGWPSWDDGTVS